MKILPAIIDNSLHYLQKTLNQPDFPFSQALMAEIYKLLFYSIQIHFKVEQFMNDKLIKTIVYDIAIYHL